MLASIRKCINFAEKKTFFHTHPHIPAASATNTTDQFEDRKINDTGNDCLMFIDGTNFQIPQTGEAKLGNWFASHKYSFKLSLHYEIGVSIIRGDLVWIHGPYPAGRFNGIAIFNNVLRHFLELGERVEADNGYVGAADKIKCPDNPCNPVENEGMQSRARYHHKTINGCFKMWGYSRKCNAMTSDCTARFFG